MDVKTVCLGMLTDGEASGYDLKKQFESSFAHFFAAGYGSIYPALSALAAEKLVVCKEIPQDGKPDRKVYRITEEGRERLLEALKKPDPSHKVRSEFLAMMCFAHLMTSEQIDAVMASRIHDIENNLSIIREFESSCQQNASPGMRFVCGCGAAVLQAMREYVQEHKDMLSSDADPKKSATG